MQALVKGHNELVAAFNKNAQGLSNSIQHLDLRVGAIALVLDDLVRGGASNVTTMGPADLGLHEAAESPRIGGVHWFGYIKMYSKQVEAELELLKQNAAKQEAAVDPLITPTETNEPEASDVIFGGKESDGEASTGYEASASG